MQWLSFGDYADAAAKVKQAGVPLIIMVQSVEEAVKAAALGADAVVAQVSFLHQLLSLVCPDRLQSHFSACTFS